MYSSSSSPPGRICHRVSLKEIADATENFDDRYALGHGGEAKVYLAQIMLGRSAITQVAVKYLKPNSTTAFDEEIRIMPKIQHPNILSLLGYCNDSGQKILIYDYMPHGSLADYVQKKRKRTNATGTKAVISLSWLQRLKICLGAALGLKHLHAETEEFPKGIIHRDVKPDNILLDANWVAKICDFGMFKLSRADQIDSAMPTMLIGTGGYYAPEYLKYQHVFGVVLFQVLCRKMPWDRGDESYYGMEDDDLGEWALQNVDSKIRGEISDYCLNAFTQVIRKSLSMNPKKRPTMDEVVLTLQNVLESQQREAAIDIEGSSIDPFAAPELIPQQLQNGMSSLRGVGRDSDSNTIPFASSNSNVSSAGIDLSLNLAMTPSSCIDESGFLQSYENMGQANPPTRIFVKVYKSGSIGRKLDIAKFSSYHELRRELAYMFGLEGHLDDPLRSGWKLVFVNRDNDVLLLGEDTWPEFVNSVWCIKILSPQEVQQMSE